MLSLVFIINSVVLNQNLKLNKAGGSTLTDGVVTDSLV